jgi:hypothetical protein
MTAVLVGVVGAVWLLDARPLVLLAAVVLGVGVVGLWSRLAYPDPESTALESATPLSSSPPIEPRTTTALRVLRPLPLGGLIVLGPLAGLEIAGLGAEPLLSAVLALLSGLAWTRIRRARAVQRWEARAAERALVVGSASSGARYRIPS